MGKIDNQFIRFLFVGIINMIFGYSLFAVFIFLKFHYALATLGATVIGILFNFKTTGKWVFQNKDNSLIFRFFSVYAVIYIINTLGLKVLNGFEINMYLAGAILAFPLAGVSFILNKKWVFEVKK